MRRSTAKAPWKLHQLKLITGLRKTGRGTLCFYGPPGTGKTELARHIARELSLEVEERRASDLLGMFVGQTEKRMAEMFDTARKNGSLLLLDEADSFLADRASARASWERTQTNEMLTQMEQFDGIFICCTNLIDHLDRAALRRFAIKTKFDYLSALQATELFLLTMAELGHREPVDPDLVVSVTKLHVLTPGDFAAVTRRMRVLGETTVAPEEVVRALKDECELKRVKGTRAVGLVGRGA